MKTDHASACGETHFNLNLMIDPDKLHLSISVGRGDGIVRWFLSKLHNTGFNVEDFV